MNNEDHNTMTEEDKTKDLGSNTSSNSGTETKQNSAPKTKSKSKKFVFNCTKCGQCCEKWEEIPVYINDLVRWYKDGSLPYVMQFLRIKEYSPYNVGLILKREKSGENDPNPSGCPLYDYTNKICNLYSSMPSFCATYPLAYNGSKYYLIDTDCPGLGNGKMTKESLSLARNRAQEYYNAKTSSQAILPLIYSLTLAEIMRKSQEAMQSLSEEDRKKLEELLEKSKKQPQTNETTESNQNVENNQN